MDFWTTFSILIVLLLAREGRSDEDLDGQSNEFSKDEPSSSTREGRIFGPRLFSNIQVQNNYGQVQNAPSRPAAFSTRPEAQNVQIIESSAAPSAITPGYGSTNEHIIDKDPVQIYPAYISPEYPIVPNMDTKDDTSSSNYISGYPIIIQIPDQHQPIAVYRGQFPAFIERIIQRIQNRYSVYNPPEYFNNLPKPEAELQPPNPPTCVEDVNLQRDSSSTGFYEAPLPLCPSSTRSDLVQEPQTSPLPSDVAGYEYSHPQVTENSTTGAANDTFVLLNCTIINSSAKPDTTTTDTTTTTTTIPKITTTTTTSEAPSPTGSYVYVTPTINFTTEKQPVPVYGPPTINFTTEKQPVPVYGPPPVPVYGPPPVPVYGPPPVPVYGPPPSQEGELFLFPPKSDKPQPLNSYLPPDNTYLPPPKPDNKPSTTKKPAPTYLPPEVTHHSKQTYPTSRPTTVGSSSTTHKPEVQPVSTNVHVNVNGYHFTKPSQQFYEPNLPQRWFQLKRLLLAKLLHL